MIMNRSLLKLDAKDAMRFANPHPVLVTLAFLAISFAGSLILTAFNVIQTLSSPTGEPGVLGLLIYMVLTVIFSLVLGAIQYGYYVYSLKVFKKENTGVMELFSHFPMMLKVLGLSLYMGLFIWLWSLLFIIPGIIAALRYSQAFYVLAENPDMSIRDCVIESKLLMKGHLWEFIILGLSFILWILLALITFGIGYLYVVPYMQITMAGYYLSLKPAPYEQETFTQF